MFRIFLAGLFVFGIIDCLKAQPGSKAEQTPADSLGIEWVFIRGGTFEMGDTFGDGGNDETPVHTVTVADFYLSATEVTFAQYDAFCEATGREKPDDEGWGRGKRPVINVDWRDAMLYCNWLSKQTGNYSEQTGNKVRLPTEAEWEYAARSGGKHEKYAGTSDENKLGDYAWYYFPGGDTTSHPVAMKKPNGLGLYDMSGNVYEWCLDRYVSCSRSHSVIRFCSDQFHNLPRLKKRPRSEPALPQARSEVA